MSNSIYGSSRLYAAPSILDEAYFGKSKDLLELEKLLDAIRQPRIHEAGRHNPKAKCNKKINLSKEIIQFDRAMEKTFGFGTFCLNIAFSPYANAYTIPLCFGIDYSRTHKNMLVDKNGYKFNPKADYALACTVYSGLLFEEKYTTEECMAVILHEIGHNFQTETNRTIGCLTSISVILDTVCGIMGLINLGQMAGGNFKQGKGALQQFLGGLAGPVNIIYKIIGSNWYQKKQIELEKANQKKNGQYAQFTDALESYVAAAKKKQIDVGDTIRAYTLGLSTVVGQAFQIAQELIVDVIMGPLYIGKRVIDYTSGRSGEALADNFATMYGYGPALSSALAKLSEPGQYDTSDIMQKANNTPLWGTIIHTVELPGNIILTAMDEHPTSIERLKQQVDLLKSELKKEELDHKMRKRIEKDISEIEDTIKKYYEVKDGIKGDPYIANRVYRAFVGKIYDMNRVNSSVSDLYRKGYDNSIEKIEKRQGDL